MCGTADFVAPLPCILFEAAPDVHVTLPLAYQRVGCVFDVAMSNASRGHWYAVVAVDEVWTAPGTPDPLHLQACMLLSCVAAPPHGGATVTCSPTYDAFAALQSFSIVGNFTESVQVLPYLSLDQVGR